MNNKIDTNLKLPKQNLFLITLLFWLTGGIYLPIWFINRDSFLCRIGEKKRSLKLLYFISLIVLIGMLISSLIINVDSTQVERNLLLEQIALFPRMITGIMGIFFIFQVVRARSIINKYLLQQSNTQKTISSLLFGTLMVIAYMSVALMTNTESALLWANFPSLLLLQNKINKLNIPSKDQAKKNMTKKIVFFIAYFSLVTIVAAAMKKPDTTIPPVSDAILIVGFFFAIGYGLFWLISNVFFKK